MAFKRKKKIIDPKYQISTTFLIIGITSFLFLVAVGFFGYSIYSTSSQTGEKLKNTVQVENDIVAAIITYAKTIQSTEYEFDIDKVKNDHDSEMNKIIQHIDQLEKMKDRNIQLLLVTVIVAIIQGVILFFLIIRITHKISGPEYVISNKLDQMLKGEKPEFHSLRKGDRLQVIYNKLKLLSEEINSK